jgi:type I site-specific restriction-modification system R (restriction) subunit
MSIVGQIEKKTQQRVVNLFREQLGYDYLGDWTEREGNKNIEEDLLRTFLREKQGYDDGLITRALHLLDKAAGDTSRSLYDRNRAVYDLMRYGAIRTQEKYYLTWKEGNPVENPLDRALVQLCSKVRFLELIHDFIVFDAGVKKLCRPNQYFGVRAAQEHVKRREGGIIWHTQGSGKSLVMVWLTKRIRKPAVPIL